MRRKVVTILWVTFFFLIVAFTFNVINPKPALAGTYVGEIRLFAGNFAPRGWAFCEGQLLEVSQNNALFSQIGTIYGGDGSTTFALPDLRGRVPIHSGDGPGLSNRQLGEKGGTETVTLTTNQMPSHSDTVGGAKSVPGNTSTPGPNVYYAQAMLDRQEINIYSDSSNIQMSTGAVGDSQQHNNMQSFGTIHYIIALVGSDPPR